MNNGSSFSKVTDQLFQILEDHVALMSLELRYETEQSSRRLGIFALSALSGIVMYLYFQIALITYLSRHGIPLYVSCLVLGILHAIAGFFIYHRCGRRHSDAGKPFQSSQEELSRSVKWIHQHLT
jgi:hypothetical protein